MSSAVEYVSPLSRMVRFLKANPTLPLAILLLVLVGLLEVLRPGIVNDRWISNTVRFATPLAMLAACQTLTMLTGGIDLSVGVVATITGYVLATQAPLVGVPMATLIALVPALIVGLVNGLGVAICRVHPLIMTLGTGLIASVRFTFESCLAVSDGLYHVVLIGGRVARIFR